VERLPPFSHSVTNALCTHRVALSSCGCAHEASRADRELLIDELNAGVDAAKVSLRKLVDALAPNHDFPFVGNPHTMATERCERMSVDR
jgi:hypothetical protein